MAPDHSELLRAEVTAGRGRGAERGGMSYKPCFKPSALSARLAPLVVFHSVLPSQSLLGRRGPSERCSGDGGSPMPGYRVCAPVRECARRFLQSDWFVLSSAVVLVNGELNRYIQA